MKLLFFAILTPKYLSDLISYSVFGVGYWTRKYSKYFVSNDAFVLCYFDPEVFEWFNFLFCFLCWLLDPEVFERFCIERRFCFLLFCPRNIWKNFFPILILVFAIGPWSICKNMYRTMHFFFAILTPEYLIDFISYSDICLCFFVPEVFEWFYFLFCFWCWLLDPEVFERFCIERRFCSLLFWPRSIW